MRYKYVLRGIIHPARVKFGIRRNIPFSLSLPDWEVDGSGAVHIWDSEVEIEFGTDTNHLQSAVCNIATLKNLIESNILRRFSDTYSFINSYGYDVEIQSISCPELDLDVTFGVEGEENLEKTEFQIDLEFHQYLHLCNNAEASFFADVFADFRRAVRYPEATGQYCFRAIEIVRQGVFGTFNEGDSERKASWAAMRDALELSRDWFRDIEEFAKRNRHGVFPKITFAERQRILNKTREIILKSIGIAIKSKGITLPPFEIRY